MQLSTSDYLQKLWDMCGGRKFTTLCGDQWGDSGKRAVESALMEFFEAFVRVSGGANTGGTYYIMGKDGLLKKLISHLLPIGCAYGKPSIIGDRVLIDLKRMNNELEELREVNGPLAAPLYISKKAPVHLDVHRKCEQWTEHVKGSNKVKTTGRGIGPMTAFSALKLNLLVGHLFEPDLVKRYVTEAYKFLQPIVDEMDRQGLISKKDYNPATEIERLLFQAEKIRDYACDVSPILHDLAARNVPTLFGLTQGYGIHYSGTYPFSSSTETISSAAAYCTALPMKYFGPVIMVSKMLPTRVGAGPFPTGWWERIAAENFAKDNPELFSDLEVCDSRKRTDFLATLRGKINEGTATDIEKAQYFMVLGNELGASTTRGREIGFPDLHITDCAAAANGVDSLIVTRADLFSGLKIKLPICLRYKLEGRQVPRYVYPTPAEKLFSAETENEFLDLDFRGIDMVGCSQENELPDGIIKLIDLFEKRLGVPVSLSTSPEIGGKIFRL